MHNPPTLELLLLVWLLSLLHHVEGGDVAEKAARSGKGVSREAVRPPQSGRILAGRGKSGERA